MSPAAHVVGIIADDLTGANDAAVQFARRGWRARLALDESTPRLDAATPERSESGTATAVVTDARAHADDLARAETAAAVSALTNAGADRIFVKIDSTMRGSVSAQVSGALDAWSVRHPDAVAVVCPAYPAMGRSIEAGRVRVNGEGVHTTSVGRDPVTPVLTDRLAELLPGSRHVGAGEPLDAGITAAAASGALIVTVDAAGDDDLRSIGDAVVALGDRCIPVGSAGFAIVLAEAWHSGQQSVVSEQSPAVVHHRVVVQVSSLHDVSRAQHAHLAAVVSPDRLGVFAPTLAEATGADAATAWISGRLTQTAELPAIVTVVSPEERSSGAGDAVSAGLAAITDALVHHGVAATAVVLLGGEGARAVLSRLGAEAITVTDAIREGIPIGVVERGRGHGLTVVTKAGGFGVESSLTDIVLELLASASPDHHLAPVARRTA